MKILFKLLSTAALLFSLLACASIPTSNSVFYQFTDNPSISLLEFDYADFHHSSNNNANGGIGHVSFSTYKIGDYLRIKWLDNNRKQEESKTISLKEGMPFIRANSTLRLTFNKLNQPEIYVSYKNPNAPVYFTFLNRSYSKVSIRQIYPEIKEIYINNNKN